MRLTLCKELLYFVPNILKTFFYILVVFLLDEVIRKYDYIFLTGDLNIDF